MGADASIGLMGLGGGFQAGSSLAAGQYNSKVAKYNAKVADMQATEALRLGEEEVGRARRRGAQVIGTQRAGFAAQGVEVNADTASLVQEDTARAVAEDVVAIRNNARREAWGYRVRATDARAQGRLARYQGFTDAAGTILGTGGQIARTGRRI